MEQTTVPGHKTRAPKTGGLSLMWKRFSFSSNTKYIWSDTSNALESVPTPSPSVTTTTPESDPQARKKANKNLRIFFQFIFFSIF